MAKITVASIKQQIAALEAKAQRIAADEMKSSVSRVRSLMNSLGVTLEHLGGKVSKKVGQANSVAVGKRPAAAKRSGAGTVRYRDPATGATWSGFGRAPGWIASAANRDDYLVSKAAPAKAAKKVAKKTTAAGRKVASEAKTAVVKAANPKAAKPKAVNKAVVSAKKSVAAKAAAAPAKKAAKKAASRKAVTEKAAAESPATPPAPLAGEAGE